MLIFVLCLQESDRFLCCRAPPYAHEDTYWTTVHATEETDLDKLVEELTESTHQELLGGPDNKQLIANRLGGKK